MSKMSQLNLAVTEEAYDMGYISLEAALADGWEIDYERGKLFKGVNALELAHKDWLAEKRMVLKDLSYLYDELVKGEYTEWSAIINNAIDFIEKGEV